jgi:hypothetical protein
MDAYWPVFLCASFSALFLCDDWAVSASDPNQQCSNRWTCRSLAGGAGYRWATLSFRRLFLPAQQSLPQVTDIKA